MLRKSDRCLPGVDPPLAEKNGRMTEKKGKKNRFVSYPKNETMNYPAGGKIPPKRDELRKEKPMLRKNDRCLPEVDPPLAEKSVIRSSFFVLRGKRKA